MRRALSKIVLLLIVALLGISVSAIAPAAKNPNKDIKVIAGKADTVDLSEPVTDVLVANPAIAEVGTLRSNRLYIVGKVIGDTNILAYDEAGNQLANITVHVRADDKTLQDTLKEFFPDEQVMARTVRNNIVLSGTVSTPDVASQVRDLASRFVASAGGTAPSSGTGANGANGGLTIVDLMKVRGEQQVMLKVKVVEAQRSALKELGLEPNFRAEKVTQNNANGFQISTTHGAVLDGADVGRTSNLTPFATGAFVLGNAGRLGTFAEAVRALEQQGLINTLAEPNLTAINGETAGFLAGGEFPVPTSRDSQGNVVLEFKQFGVSLNFTPTVLNKKRIALHLSTEVSAKDNTGGVVLQNITIPGLTVRRAETTIEMGSGNTLMIAGLIKSDTLHAFSGLPGVQDLPILGQLFKSRSFSRNESELVIMVTPYLVNSFAQSDAVAEAEPPNALQKMVEAKVPEKQKEQSPEASAPEKTKDAEPSPAPAPSPKKPSPPASTQNTVPDPLSRRLLANFRKTYGSRVPDKIGSGKSFGYIVD